MNTNKVTAISSAIIAIGVIAAGITYGAKEYDKNKKINAKSECMGYGSKYKRYMTNAMSGMGPEYTTLAQQAYEDCLSKKGYRLRY